LHFDGADNIGRVLLYHLYGLCAGAGFVHHADVWLRFQKGADPLPNHFVIINQ